MADNFEKFQSIGPDPKQTKIKFHSWLSNHELIDGEPAPKLKFSTYSSGNPSNWQAILNERAEVELFRQHSWPWAPVDTTC